MVSAINTTYQNTYTSAVTNSYGTGSYSSVADGNPSISKGDEVQDSGIINDYILESQNEIFAIQINTQNGLTLVNTTKATVDDMQNVIARLKEKINTLSDSSTSAQINEVQEDIDELLDELYETKNGAKYYGKLLLGKYNEKPARLGADAEVEANAKNSQYMNSASYQIGYSSQENSTMTINTAFSLGGFSVTINSPDDIASALGVTEALEADLLNFEKTLDSQKETLTQNSVAAAEQMKKLLSYEAEPQMSEDMAFMKSLSQIRTNFMSEIVSLAYGFDPSRLSQIMTKAWR